MTSAPWSAAQRMPAATSSAEPVAVQLAAGIAAVRRAPAPPAARRRAPRRRCPGRCRWRPARCRPRGCRGRCRPGPSPEQRAGVAVGADAADVPDELRREVLVGRGRRRVDHRDGDALAGARAPTRRARRCARGPTGGPARTRGRSGVAPPAPAGASATSSAEPAHRRGRRAIGRTGASTHHRSEPAQRARDGGGSEAAQDGDDLAEDRHVVGVELHRRRAGRSTGSRVTVPPLRR